MVQVVDNIEHPHFTLEIGKLCAAWSYFEMVTDYTLWGIMGVAPEIGAIISGKHDILSRWSLIINHDPTKFSEDEMAMFRKIKAALHVVTCDRNIIVHGLIMIDDATNTPHARITKGERAGKYHLITSDMVKHVMNNVIFLSRSAKKIANAHGWVTRPPMGEIVTDWAKPIEGFP